MKKYLRDLILVENQKVDENHILLKLTQEEPMPCIQPGQFVEIKVEKSPNTFLRRPISIHFVDTDRNELWLLIQIIGEGTAHLATLKAGDKLNVVFPLGNGFTLPEDKSENVLLVGGGVGIAPMLYFAKRLTELGCRPSILVGVKTKADLLLLDAYRKYGKVYVSTEDGSMGDKGFVTQHSVLEQEKFDRICCCGPRPMMAAMAKYAKSRNITCEVSLENKMACGIGACLCCVEDTKEGNLCVCKEGPVFNINQLLWQI